MKNIFILLAIFISVCCNEKQSKADKFISTHDNYGGGGCISNSYKIWKDGMVCYIKTTKAIDYSIQELSDIESLHLFTFIKNDKGKNVITVKIKDKNDIRALQGFVSELICK